MEARALGMGLTRGFFYQFTTKNISVVKIFKEHLLTRGVLLESGLWHNTDSAIYRAFTPSAEGRLSCRSTLTSSHLCPTRPPVLPVPPFPKAIPI